MIDGSLWGPILQGAMVVVGSVATWSFTSMKSQVKEGQTRLQKQIAKDSQDAKDGMSSLANKVDRLCYELRHHEHVTCGDGELGVVVKNGRSR